ncbi:hypothetical protein C8R45DRAFT_925403 [Mycena sanguinolenta]|nr:hypothetical protein C8R45DRAFT_925403 [Mycena sanguinolenta]
MHQGEVQTAFLALACSQYFDHFREFNQAGNEIQSGTGSSFESRLGRVLSVGSLFLLSRSVKLCGNNSVQQYLWGSRSTRGWAIGGGQNETFWSAPTALRCNSSGKFKLNQAENKTQCGAVRTHAPYFSLIGVFVGFLVRLEAGPSLKKCDILLARSVKLCCNNSGFLVRVEAGSLILSGIAFFALSFSEVVWEQFSSTILVGLLVRLEAGSSANTSDLFQFFARTVSQQLRQVQV